MTRAAAPLALATGLLVLTIVLAIALIPVIDVELRRTTARRAGNDNRRAAARELRRRA